MEITEIHQDSGLKQQSEAPQRMAPVAHRSIGPVQQRLAGPGKTSTPQGTHRSWG